MGGIVVVVVWAAVSVVPVLSKTSVRGEDAVLLLLFEVARRSWWWWWGRAGGEEESVVVGLLIGGGGDLGHDPYDGGGR